ncbi:MAG: helix-turn-helix transcriptional regulator [Pseudomonadota bacterium]
MTDRKRGRPPGRKSGAGPIEKAVRLPPGVANPVDVHVGQRVRLRRTLLGLSQEKLGAAVGLTFQQIQKYERGANRIGASRLYEFSKILDVPISYFFEDMPGELKTHSGRFKAGLRDHDQEEITRDPLVRRETLELVRAYYRIQSPRARKRLFELTKSLARMTRGED